MQPFPQRSKAGRPTQFALEPLVHCWPLSGQEVKFSRRSLSVSTAFGRWTHAEPWKAHWTHFNPPLCGLVPTRSLQRELGLRSTVLHSHGRNRTALRWQTARGSHVASFPIRQRVHLRGRALWTPWLRSNGKTGPCLCPART